MGLEGAELLMEVEDEWDLEFYGVDETFETVGDLYRWILARLAERQSGWQSDPESWFWLEPVCRPCPTSRLIFQFRRFLERECGVDRRRIRPDARLEFLFPKTERLSQWNQVRQMFPGTPTLEWFTGDFPIECRTVKRWVLAVLAGQDVESAMFRSCDKHYIWGRLQALVGRIIIKDPDTICRNDRFAVLFA